MENLETPVNVKAMKGKFEQTSSALHSDNPMRIRSKNYVCERSMNNVIKKQTPSSFVNANAKNNGKSLHNTKINEGLSHLVSRGGCGRYKISRKENSFNEVQGQDFTDDYRKRTENNNTLFPINNQTSIKKEFRPRSFSMTSHKYIVTNNDRKRDSKNDNLHSFTEKQKLVESIVMNIKNSGNANAKEHKTNKISSSKMEKDLKNALEKGVRKLTTRYSSEKFDADTKENHNQIIRRKPFVLKKQTLLQEVSNTENPLESYSKINTHSDQTLGEVKNDSRYKQSITDSERISRPLLPTSLDIPIRPPRRKSPKKLNQISVSLTSIDVDEQETHNSLSKNDDSFLDCEPPKKPPRTFAHDIYMTSKQEQQMLQEPNPHSRNVGALTPAEIELLYAKPIKKNKLTSSNIPNLNEQKQVPKPLIAPKPSPLVSAEAMKRFSVVEVPTNNKEFSEAKKSSVKRNSSFRFSFKKPKKSSTYHSYSQPQPSTPKQDLKFTSKFFNKHNNSQKKVRFSQRSKSEEGLYDQEDRIYATPHEDYAIKKTANKPELHYMCSPLFEEDNISSDYEPSPLTLRKDNNNETPTKAKIKDFRSKFGLDGIKQEWRQSYRFVQKRLKELSPQEKRL